MFRKTRLALGRGFPTWEAARDFAIRLRRERFHDRDAIHVVDDTTGQPCALPPDEQVPANENTSADVPTVSGPRRTGYTVCASFHRGHIPLARNVGTLDEAAAVVERFRRNRFDRSQSLVIVDEATGERLAPSDVELSSAPGRERILELQSLADEVATVLSAAAVRERWQPWSERAARVHEVSRTLLSCGSATAPRRRPRSMSGVRRREPGAV